MEVMRHNEACIYFHIVLTMLLGHGGKQAVLEGIPSLQLYLTFVKQMLSVPFPYP